MKNNCLPIYSDILNLMKKALNQKLLGKIYKDPFIVIILIFILIFIITMAKDYQKSSITLNNVPYHILVTKNQDKLSASFIIKNGRSKITNKTQDLF